MDWQLQLISLYLEVCKYWQEEGWVQAQRFAPFADLSFTDEEVATIYLFADVAKRIKTDKAHTQSFVKYHAITGSQVFAGSIRNRRASPSSASGESLSFDGIGGTPKVNTAHLVMPDLQAPNGVVHIIDAALVPPSFTEPPAAKEPVAASPTAAGMEKDFTQENAAAPSAPAGAPQAEKSPSTGWKKIFGW